MASLNLWAEIETSPTGQLMGTDSLQTRKYLVGFLSLCYVCAFAAAPTAAWAHSGKAFPDTLEAKRFLGDYETCEHLAGEIRGDGSEDDKETMRNLDQVCAQANKKWRGLRKKYAKDPVVMAWLNRYDLHK